MLKMRKLLKNITAAALCLTLAVCFAVPCVVYARGNLNNTVLDEEFAYGIANEDVSKADGSDIRIMSANLLAHYESWGGKPARSRAKMFIEVISAYAPDVAGLQEVCDEWLCCLLEGLPDNYKFIHPVSTFSFIHMTTMIYNSDTLKFIDSGEIEFSQIDDARTRRAVWAVFETKSNGIRFAVTSTHFSFPKNGKEAQGLAMMSVQADEMYALSEKIENEYGCTVFLTGDFNSTEEEGSEGKRQTTEVYKKLSTVLTDAKYCAESTFDGDGFPISRPCLDHIFINGTADVKSFGYLSNKYMSKMSDHYPVIADIKI